MKDKRYTALIRVNVYAPNDKAAKLECKMLESVLKRYDDNFDQTLTLNESPRDLEEPRYIIL